MKLDKITIRIILGSLLLGCGIIFVSCEKGMDSEIVKMIVPEIKGWEPLFLNVADNLNDIHFINDNSGWIVGENQTLIATASGDIGWSLAPVDLPLENLRSVFFVDDQMGWIVGDLSGNPILGQVAYTANGGGYPTQQEIFDKPLYSLFFIDRQIGWAAGLDGLIVQTLNGGSDWKAIPAFTDKPIYDLYFTEDGSGWAVTGGGGIFSTRDGIEWAMEPTGIDTDIFSIHMLDESNGWACGKKNSILKRIMMEDGKASWTIIVINSVPSGQIWNDIFFLDPSTGWVVGELGQIYKTTDGGISWKNEESNVTSNLNAIYMVSQVKGWIAGDEGVVISYNAR